MTHLISQSTDIQYSKYQLRIREHFANACQKENRNFAVDGVAGCGKSFTARDLIKMIKNEKKDRNSSILSLQFNTHIKKAMEDSLGQLPNVDVKTLSGAGLMVCKSNKYRMKGNKPAYTKYYQMAKTIVTDKLPMIAEQDGGITKKDQLMKKAISQLTDIVSMSMNTLVPLGNVIEGMEMCGKYSLECIGPIMFEMAETVIGAGMEVLDQGMMAFNDMIYAPVALNMEFTKYDYILCDEYQDFNACQLELISRFMDDDTIIGGFGDEKQSIMMFTGAMSDSVSQFKDKFNTRSLPLSICYRCPSSVLDLARIIVPWIKNRDNCPEGLVTVMQSKEEVSSMGQGGDYVLCRLTAPLVSMCIQFIKLRKPAKVKGKEIGDRIHKMYDEVVDGSEIKPLTCEDFMARLKEWRDREQMRLIEKKSGAVKIDMMNDTADCLKVIADYISIEARQANRRTHYMEVSQELKALFSDDIGDNYVTLCTVHKAKGLEADRVFIIEMDKMPYCPPNRTQSTEQRTQETNILYVALTRARKELYFQGLNITNYQELVSHIMKCQYIEPVIDTVPW